MFRRRGKAPRRSELTAFIDEGSEIEGRYTFRGTVMLNGKFKGEISSNDTLIIGERAVLQADVRAGRLVVNGEVTGNLSAMERIELKRTARVYGDVEAPVIPGETSSERVLLAVIAKGAVSERPTCGLTRSR